MKKLKHTIDEVLPWGRSLDEYRRMFDLSDADLEGPILGCADGPAGFNAELTARGGNVVSVDPVYQFSTDQIRSRIDHARELIVANTIENCDAYRWDEIPDIDALVALRMNAMNTFLDDFDRGKQEGRYQDAELPDLPFQDAQFRLALCSHFLFTYSELLSLNFHLDAIVELLRVADEVRVFPLLDMNGGPSPHLEPLLQSLRDRGHAPQVLPAPYEYQKGGNHMLRVQSAPATPPSDGPSSPNL